MYVHCSKRINLLFLYLQCRFSDGGDSSCAEALNQFESQNNQAATEVSIALKHLTFLQLLWVCLLLKLLFQRVKVLNVLGQLWF